MWHMQRNLLGQSTIRKVDLYPMLRRQDRKKLNWSVMLSRHSQPPTSDNDGNRNFIAYGIHENVKYGAFCIKVHYK
jgi:hypothetical protein